MDAHAREAAAAAAGMEDTYGRKQISPGRTVIHRGQLRQVWDDGDFVLFSDQDGELWHGTVMQHQDHEVYVIRAHVPGGGTRTFAVPEEQIYPY